MVSTPAVESTAGNPEWRAEHKQAILAMFPETWTHVANVNMLKLRWDLKILGVDFRTDTEVAACLAHFEKAKLIHREGMTFRRGT